jgi:hypothetical protein
MARDMETAKTDSGSDDMVLGTVPFEVIRRAVLCWRYRVTSVDQE